jgi:hypothetical protein
MLEFFFFRHLNLRYLMAQQAIEVVVRVPAKEL